MPFIAMMSLAATLVALVGAGQPAPGCPPAGWTEASLATLKSNKFAMADAAERRSLALALTACLGDPNPALRDGIAFEALTTWLRGAALDGPTVRELRDRLVPMLTSRDPQGFRAPFAAIVMSEVARTDRMAPWMSADERAGLVQAAAVYLSGIEDYRAFNSSEGYRHGVAHGADFVLQLALNPAITKPQLDRLLAAIATQVSPRLQVSYTAGEPDRLARAVIFIAQRGLHSPEEWQAFFNTVTTPTPLASWGDAFASEIGLAKRHNTRAFLLSLYATASSTDDTGVRQLLAPVGDGLKRLP